MEENTETIEDNVEPVQDEPVDQRTESAEPKKRGRPAGAKDRAPRKKKINIVVEPIRQASLEIEEPPRPATPPQTTPAPAQGVTVNIAPVEAEEVSEPDSPRTNLIKAQKKFHDSRCGGESKLAKVQDVYIKRLASTHQLTACR